MTKSNPTKAELLAENKRLKEKSPAETIAELKEKVTRLEKGEGKNLLDKLEAWRKQRYERCRMHNPEFHWVKESECNAMWYSETEFLKKLRKKL